MVLQLAGNIPPSMTISEIMPKSYDGIKFNGFLRKLVCVEP
jgi:hypothetical protein